MNFKRVLSALAIGSVLAGSLAACAPALSEAEACDQWLSISASDTAAVKALRKTAPSSMKKDLKTVLSGDSDAAFDAGSRLSDRCL